MLRKPGQSIAGDDHYFLVPALGRVIALLSSFPAASDFSPESNPLCQPQ